METGDEGIGNDGSVHMIAQIETSRLKLTEFQMSDAEDVFGCITPAITKFLFWEVPASLSTYKERREQWLKTKEPGNFSFVVRRRDTKECLGIASLEEAGTDFPELGLWLKESSHGNGYGREAVIGVAGWAARILLKSSFRYTVAVENTPSRRIAEGLGGKIIATRSTLKYDSVVYRIP